MAGEASTKEVIKADSKPNRSMVRRAAGFMVGQTCRTIAWPLTAASKTVSTIAGVRSAGAEAKLLEAGDDAQASVDAVRLRGRGREFLYALRENFGDALNSGLIVRPQTEGPSSLVMVRATSHDNRVAHETEAVIAISRGEHVGQMALRAVEPTLGAKRLGAAVEPSTSVEMAGVSFMDAAETLHSVQAACDRGEIEAYEGVHAVQA